MASSALLLAVIVFLAPGLSVFAGLFLFGGRKEFRPAPPTPGSVAAISFIVLGSLVAHGISATIAYLSGLVAWIEFDFDPNPYYLLYSAVIRGIALSDGALTYAIVVLAFLPFLTFATSYFVGGLLLRTNMFAGFVYGWSEQIARESSPENNWIVAFVLTKARFGEYAVGYEGAIAELNLDSNKQIRSLVLKDVDRFLLSKQRGTFRRVTPIVPAPRFGTLYVPGDQIENVAFTIFQLEE